MRDFPSAAEVDDLLERLFPICRSITGDGTRRTLEILSEIASLTMHEVPSGASCYDWTIPPEWNVSEAWIKDNDGNKVVDFQDSNLHLVNYSVPVHDKLTYDELAPHLHSLPNLPGAIPYRTSYYRRTWGFCLRHDTLQGMDRDATYEVFIDSELDPDGTLTYADARVEGESDKEYLLSTYCCHPSLANDNLSGLILSSLLFARLQETNPYHSYRLIVVPETIGAVAYLARNESTLKQVDGGYVITTVAGPGPFGYKSSFHGNTDIDLAARAALADVAHRQYPFTPSGSDERQYASPGFRIPTGTITKDKYYEYDAYHTSKDDLNFISADDLLKTMRLYWRAVQNLEANRVYRRTEPHCEYQLGKHGLYPDTGGTQQQPAHLGDEDHADHEYDASSQESSTAGRKVAAMEWLMHGIDGSTSILELADRSGLPPTLLHTTAREMKSKGLLEEVS